MDVVIPGEGRNTGEDAPPAGRRTFDVGSAVEVRSSFSGRWVPGFDVAECDRRGYRIRRTSDRTVLPEWIGAERVRSTTG